jgi:ArsR family metal-binding transcriptional regulator
MALVATLHETRDLVRAVYPRLARDDKIKVGASLNATLGEIVPLLNAVAERNGYGVRLDLEGFVLRLPQGRGDE